MSTSADVPGELPADGPYLPELLAIQAARTPDAAALVCANQMLTYREFDERANQLARHLTDLGVGPDVVVGLYLERSLDMIVGLFGILRAGGAYLPLDANVPTERLSLILRDAKPPIVVTQRALADRLRRGGTVAVCLDGDRTAIDACDRDSIDSRARPANLAYVIYTSGSAGIPKGVMIDHRALRDRALAKAAIYRINPDDRILQFTALSFDAAAAEIYPTLTSGAALVIHPRPRWTSPLELLDECERHGVTGLMLPPVYLQLLVDSLAYSARSVPWLRLLVTGGESIPVERLAAWARLVPHRPHFVYAYGPTETAIAATLYIPPMDPAEIGRLDRVPIGRPLPHTGAHLLDERLQPVGAGEVGELWITGTGLARGYLGDPALTAERFLPSPFGETPGARMYRTGDLARTTAAGDLEFLGRVDAQVKIRGFRVDMDEVEAALATHPEVSHAVVVPHDGRLAAYWVPAGRARPTPGELREFLRPTLPDYMIPAVIMMLDALPLTPGGKIDHRVLPVPREDEPRPEPPGGEPSSPIEILLGQIWCELLRRDRVGVTEDFFQAGGDSLLANQVVSRIRDVLGVDIPLREIFLTPTIAGLAQAVTSLSVSADGAAGMRELLANLERMPDEGARAHPHPEVPRS